MGLVETKLAIIPGGGMSYSHPWLACRNSGEAKKHVNGKGSVLGMSRALCSLLLWQRPCGMCALLPRLMGKTLIMY